MSLLLQITIFLGAALLLVPLGKRFGIATVIGYLLTGIVLGPHVLNVATDAKAIMHMAEFGVILLMFIIGLELRPQRLWQMRHSIFVMGSTQVILTGMVLMGLVFLVFKQSVTSSFIIGFARRCLRPRLCCNYWQKSSNSTPLMVSSPFLFCCFKISQPSHF